MTAQELESRRTKTEIYSRVCGYLRPTMSWNDSKAQEFEDRVVFKNKEV